MLRKLEFKGNTTLKGIEAHRLRELILTDLAIYKTAGIGEIHKRIGDEIPRRKIRHELQKLVEEEIVTPEGENKWRRYVLTKSS